MVQTYGTSNKTSKYPEVEDANAGEGSALLADGTSKKPTVEGHASLISCISNLSNTIIGSGMLTFPMALASAGLIPGMLTCIFSGSVAVFGLYLLSVCATKCKPRHASFHAISKLTFPSAAIWFDAAIAIKCFGVSISYLIIIKSLMPNVVASLYHDLTSPDTNPPDWALSGQMWLALLMVVLVPLAFLRKLDSLRHTSYVALFSVAYLVIIVVTCYFKPLKGTMPAGDIHLIRFSSKFVSTFPVQVFAFTCSQNLFPLYNELVNNSQKRMTMLVGTSIGSATLTYEIIAVFGYLTFGSKVGANIIAMYPSTSLFIAIGQLAIVILVLFSYPLQVHPCRNCLDKMLYPDKPTTVTNDDSDEEDEDHPHTELTAWKHAILTSIIIGLGFLVAFNVDDLGLVLAFVGSTGSTTISFILPGLFYWKLTRGDPSSKSMNRAAFALVVYGFCVFVFCFGFNVYSIFQPGSSPTH